MALSCIYYRDNGIFKEDFKRNRMQCLIGGKWLFLKGARTDSMSKKMMGGEKAVLTQKTILLFRTSAISLSRF